MNVYAEVKTEPNERFRHVLREAPFALKFTVLGELDKQRLDKLMATLATLIANDVPVILAVAAPAKHMGGYRLLNADLKELAVNLDTRFPARFAKILQELIDTPPVLVPLD
jgi:hypothetical protein